MAWFKLHLKRKDTAADTALADGKYGEPQMDASGNLRVVDEAARTALGSPAQAGEAAAAAAALALESGGNLDDIKALLTTLAATAITTWGPTKTVSMQAGAFTVPLGAAYKNIRVWSSQGASTYRVNFGAAADNTMAVRDDTMKDTYNHVTGQSTVYLFGDGDIGKINIEAWN